jgi:hypothetical protein
MASDSALVPGFSLASGYGLRFGGLNFMLASILRRPWERWFQRLPTELLYIRDLMKDLETQ